MFLKDLEPYRHGLPTGLKDVIAIGWLSRTVGYPQGEAPIEFTEALAKWISLHRVNQMRGYHVCEFCSKSPLTYETGSGEIVMLGSAEIWIPSMERGVIYAAPDLIYHYVREHRYLPPSDFINAAMSFRDRQDWDANSECRRRLEAAFRT
jgi:hypothetical protein